MPGIAIGSTAQENVNLGIVNLCLPEVVLILTLLELMPNHEELAFR